MDIYSEIGRIKSLEKKFLTLSQLQALIETKSLNEFVSITENSFYKIPPSVLNIGEIYEIFDNERIAIYDEIEKHCPSLTKIFLLKNDFLNLKIILEGKNDYILPSNIPGQILKMYIEERKAQIPDFLNESVKILKGENDIEEKLLQLKNEYYNQLYKFLKEFNSRFIINYVKIEIDFANLATFLLKNKKEEKIVPDILIKNGNIKREKFITKENIFNAFKIEYKNIEIPLNEENIEFERYKVVINHIKRGRIISNGIEAIFSYFVAREIELECVQRLFFGKFYNIDENILKKWVIPPYQWG